MGRGHRQREVAEKEHTRQEAWGDIYLDDLLGQMNAEELKAFIVRRNLLKIHWYTSRYHHLNQNTKPQRPSAPKALHR